MTAAIPAATGVLLRPAAAGFELLLVERHGGIAFAGGATVFPGGRVDPGDAAVAADPALGLGFAGLDAVDAAARVAAARESFEEADVLLSDGPALDPAIRADWRARLDAGAVDFAAFLAGTGHRLDAARLTPFAHWVPREANGLARRFDTRFYLARLPPGETATPDGREAVAARWLAPAAALAAADAGRIAIIFPTRRNLERLAQYAGVEALVAATAARPLIRIEPAVTLRDGVSWLTIPTGCDYPVTEERQRVARRE